MNRSHLGSRREYVNLRWLEFIASMSSKASRARVAAETDSRLALRARHEGVFRSLRIGDFHVLIVAPSFAPVEDIAFPPPAAKDNDSTWIVMGPPR